jgi:iron complex outermembrane receptor protein
MMAKPPQSIGLVGVTLAKAFGLAVFTAAYLFVSTASGQQGPPVDPRTLQKLTLEELSEIEISSVAKEQRPAFQTPAAIYVMTSEEIRRSGALTIPDLLRLIPGVQVSQLDSVRWAIGIRGFQGRLSRSVLVLFDGRSVYTPLFAGVYWEMHDTLIEDIDRIEVIRGPGGTIWGANAVNGVINIITKRAQATRGAYVAAGGGNLAQGFLHMRYGGGSDRLSYRIYGKGFTRGPMYHPDGRNFDDWRMAQTGFRMDWVKNPRDTITIQGDAYTTIAGTKLNISTFSPPAIRAVEDNGYFSGQNLQAVWQRKYDSGAELRLQTYYDRTDREDLNYREIRNTVDVDLIHHFPWKRHATSWGIGARISPSRYFQTVPTVDFQPHEQTYNIFSSFLEDQYTLVPGRLYVTAGVKLQHNSFSSFELQPTARLSWAVTERQSVWAAATRAVRTPSRIEHGFSFSALQSPSPPLYVRLVGDNQFDSERLNGSEIGYRRYFRGNGFLGISTFHNRYDDLLSVESRPPEPEASPPPLHLVLPLYLRNGVEATTTGVEVAGLWDLRSWWRFNGSYSIAALDAKRKPGSNDASTVRQLEGDSAERKLILISRMDLPRRFELDLVFRHASEVPNQQAPAYSTGDVRLGWRILPQLELSVTGRNLLQPSHVEYGGSPGALVRIRRSAHLKLAWGR